MQNFFSFAFPAVVVAITKFVEMINLIEKNENFLCFSVYYVAISLLI